MEDAIAMTKAQMSKTRKTRKQYNETYYTKHSNESYECPYCLKTIKAVSKPAHEKGQAHLRAVVLSNMHYDNETPRVDVSVSTTHMTYSISRDERNRNETPFERDAQNAHYNAFMLTHAH
jgi:hypothetical protein